MTEQAAKVAGLRGVDLGVPDVAAHTRFYTSVWNLSVAAERDGSVYLRGRGSYHHILALHPRVQPCLLSINLAAENRAAVDARHPDADASPDRPLKITHVVLNTPRQEEAAAFWVNALGLEVSDRSLLTFLRCGADHHSLAFHPGESATLHHIAFEMDSIDSVMRGAGRMRDAGRPIEWGPGRHGPGNNVFAYFVGPDDFVIEYTAEIEQLDDSYRVGQPAQWVYPAGHSDLWGATAPPARA